MSNLIQNQTQPNLLDRKVVGDDRAIPRAWWLARILTGLCLLGAVGGGYVTYAFFRGTYSLTILLIGLSVFLVVSLVGSLVTRSLFERLIIVCLQSIAFVVWLPQSLGIRVATGIGLVLILGLGEYTTFRARSRMLEFDVFGFSRNWLSFAMTGMVLLVIVWYVPQVATGDTLIPEEQFVKVVSQVTAALPTIYPGVQSTSTVGVLAASVARNQLENNPQFIALSSEEQEKLIDQATAVTIQELEKRSNISLKTNDGITTALYRLFNQLTNQWRTTYGIWFVLFWTAVSFFVIRSAGFILALGLSVIAWLLVLVLTSFGLIVTRHEPASREVIELV